MSAEKQTVPIEEIIERNTKEECKFLKVDDGMISSEALHASIQHNEKEIIRAKLQYEEENRMFREILKDYESFSDEEKEKAKEFMKKVHRGQSYNPNNCPKAFTHLQELIEKDNEMRRLINLRDFYQKIILKLRDLL